MTAVIDGQTMQRDREQLQAEGVYSGNIQELQPKAVWYKADGALVWPEGQRGPADEYHIMKFRAKGWTLAHPQQIEHNREERQAREGLPDMNPPRLVLKATNAIEAELVTVHKLADGPAVPASEETPEAPANEEE